jgi:ketosteroid isomerase-like protein
VTPDQGEITGREGTTEYFRQLLDTFTDTQFEHIAKYESGNVAIDEGYFIGTNTGDLQMPGGESMPATGRQLRVRDCDVMVVEDGLIREHRFYCDQWSFSASWVCFRGPRRHQLQSRRLNSQCRPCQ